MQLKTISNRQLKLLRKLNRKKYREREGLFLIEGPRAVRQVLDNGVLSVEGLFFDESGQLFNEAYWSEAAEEREGVLVSAGDFEEVADTDNPQGVMALCRTPGEAGRDTLASATGLLLATDAIQDPGNLGTIIRTASWFGVRGLLSGRGTVDLFHPKVVRSTAGATGTVPYRNVELEAALDYFEEKGWRVLLLDAGPEAVSLNEIGRDDKTILVVGNEAHGIDDSLPGGRRRAVHIPGQGGEEGVESLNAAVAAGIALYRLA